MELTSGIIYGLIAMLAYGLSNAIVKIPAKNVGSVKTIFYRNVITVPMLFIIFLLFLPLSTLSIQFIFIAFMISLFGYLPLFSFFKALGMGKVGIVTPIANSSVVFTILLSILFFHESLSTVQFFSIGMIVSGIILISLDFNDLKKSELFNISSGIPYALVSTLMWGVLYFLLKIPVSVLGPILSSFILEFSTLIFSGVHLKLAKASFSVPGKYNLKYIFFMAITGAIGTLSFNYGINVAEVSIVAALTFANPLISTIYARLVYKEELCIMQYVAIALMISGIFSISYF